MTTLTVPLVHRSWVEVRCGETAMTSNRRDRVARRPSGTLPVETLVRMTAPTLLIVRGEDRTVITPNCRAYAYLHCEKELRIVAARATSSRSPRALEEVATRACEWFSRFHHANR